MYFILNQYNTGDVISYCRTFVLKPRHTERKCCSANMMIVKV
jgi:hypothetical protein